jgi:hypothetical protein
LKQDRNSSCLESFYGKESRRSENSNKDSPKIIMAIEENEDNQEED